MADVTMRIWRGDSTGGDFETFTISLNEGEVVLDIIHRIQATEAPDLACRWNCKAGKCGSCSAEINGKPRLMCMTRMDQLPEGPVTVTPMKTFPIIRDLVTDVSFNFEMAKRYRRCSRRRCPRAATACSSRTSSAARSSASASSASCAKTSVTSSATTRRTRSTTPDRDSSSATPSSRCTPSTPTTAATWSKRRWGSGYCNITKCCTEVCPEHIHITDNAIIPLKERVVDADYDPVAWLGRKIRRRTKKTAAEAAVQPAP